MGNLTIAYYSLQNFKFSKKKKNYLKKYIFFKKNSYTPGRMLSKHKISYTLYTPGWMLIKHKMEKFLILQGDC